MNPPAPGPVSGLSATHEANAAAMQASTALPPSASARAPACAVISCPAGDRSSHAKSLGGGQRSLRNDGGDISSPFRRRGLSPKPVATMVTHT